MKITYGLLVISFLSIFSFDSLAQEFVAEKVSFDSPEHDYSSTIYKDGIVFCTTREKRQFMNMEEGIFYTDIYYVEYNDGVFGEPTPFLDKTKSRLNDGPGTFNQNQDEFIYTSNLKTASSGNPSTLGLFTTRLKRDSWVGKMKFLYNDQDLIVAHPTLSSDGNTLVFAANFIGAKGGSIDLYYSTWKNEKWSKPKSLGKAINSRGREKFPVFNPDGKLYFSSDGYPNCEGLDIFSTEFEKGKWMEPTRLEAPYNSSSDDFSYIFSYDKDLEMVSSSRDSGIDELFIIKEAKSESLDIDYAYLDYILIMMEIEEDAKVNIYGYSFDSDDALECQEKAAKVQLLATNYLMSKGVDMKRISVSNLGSSSEYEGNAEGTFLQYEATYNGKASFITPMQLSVNE